jgi:hypothetical protein
VATGVAEEQRAGFHHAPQPMYLVLSSRSVDVQRHHVRLREQFFSVRFHGVLPSCSFLATSKYTTMPTVFGHHAQLRPNIARVTMPRVLYANPRTSRADLSHPAGAQVLGSSRDGGPAQ